MNRRVRTVFAVLPVGLLLFAGFVVPILGSIVRMPGLPPSPQAERIDLRDGVVEVRAS